MDNKAFNKKLITEYPFLLPRNLFSDKVSEDYDYSYTLLDLFPEGWRNTFALNMLSEIKDELININQLEEFRILEIKEKYGTLHFYTNFTTDKLNAIICKYEDLSMLTCYKCGNPSTHVSLGWITYLCNDCISNSKNVRKLTSEDIPIRTLYKDGKEETLDSFYKNKMLNQWR